MNEIRTCGFAFRCLWTNHRSLATAEPVSALESINRHKVNEATSSERNEKNSKTFFSLSGFESLPLFFTQTRQVRPARIAASQMTLCK